MPDAQGCPVHHCPASHSPVTIMVRSDSRRGWAVRAEWSCLDPEAHMRDLTSSFLELIRLAATDLPAEVERSLRTAQAREALGSAAAGALETILENVALARQNSTPVCQDTGTPIFYVKYPEGWSTRKLREQIRQATAQATAQSYLRPNAVDSLSGKNSGKNLGDTYFPTIHFEETEEQTLTPALMLKGGGCENAGAQVSLPNSQLVVGG